MTSRQDKKNPYYPRTHLLAASGVAALMSLTLLVFPSREVEAKRSSALELELPLETAELQPPKITTPHTESANSSSDVSASEVAVLAAPSEKSRPAESAVEKDAVIAEEIQASLTDTTDESTEDEGGFFSFFSDEDEPEADTEAADTSGEQPTTALAEETLEPAEEPAQSEWQALTVASGETLSTLFNRAGLSATQLHAALNSSKEAKQFTRLKVGQVVEFKVVDAELHGLRSQLSKLASITLLRDDNGFKFQRDEIKPEVHTRFTQGTIQSSLFLAGKHAGMSHSLVMELANIFGYDIDFAREIRKGDSFELVYEEKIVEGSVVGSGEILAARFTNRGKEYQAVRYTNKQGITSYYLPSGLSMRKAFIRTPVDFARISSRFSMGRKHPILNKIRAHKGVDYAAPRGTPIKAAGAGKVVLAGRKGGYGNTVIIQHGQTYRTLYAHMNGFARGVRNGVAVKQGQVIGYIGTTGLSTGPHLHYEFLVNGVHRDPLGIKMPMADPIHASEKQRFFQQTKPLLAQLDNGKKNLLAKRTE
ncbi:peptidoglycan DD-metalloendopeptidase family protein [Atopomonas sediminilitoris]|uniref:peptidoglycan DD-metalloendopeptidase family protein n=1 Tax=Atopomonas sediminilitoris TaxID=2919919 RepID=UPI001F4EE992|nr:peptidoglycan DD-metalloendopeptidase family protein [Atopomonas sediminilitoris]MCJ8168544.1 peptidoglycan DD-metalloendopeptidase family protein [Atopomonas sediminilitoris]